MTFVFRKQKNDIKLKCLWKQIIRRILTPDIQFPKNNIMVEICRALDGNLTIKKDNMFLLSFYSPVRDVKRFVDRFKFKEDTFYILFGAAIGYLPEEIKRKGVSPDEILIFLPLEVEKNYLGSEYTIITESNITEIFEKKLSEGKRPEFIVLESYKKAFDSEFSSFEKLVTANLKIALENLKVTAFFSKVWFFNLLRNLFLAVEKKWKYLEIEKKIDIPILICGAGPSLNLKLKEIRGKRDGFILISVLSALETLLNAEIVPDYVMITDGGVTNSLYFKNLPDGITIFADIYASSSFLSKLNSNVVLINLKEELNNPVFHLNEPSVTVAAGKLAKRITTSSVIFCGFDMAYSLETGSHSYPNVFSMPQSKNYNRMNSLVNYAFSFLKRDDLTETEGSITNKQFLLLRESVKSLFSDSYYLDNDIGLKFCMPLDRLKIEKKFSGRVDENFTARIVRDDIIKFLEFLIINMDFIIEKLTLKERIKKITCDDIRKELKAKSIYLIEKIKRQLQDLDQ